MHVRHIAFLLFGTILCAGALFAQQALPVATRTLDLREQGFQSIAGSKRLSEDAYFTVDYLDSNDLLVTFVKPGLVKRHAECPQSHSDRIISAVVLEISTGKAVRQAEWYVHDRLPFLWSLHDGRFLLRIGNQLYRLDRDLNQKLVFDSPKDLLWVDVTPDAKQIITETELATAKADTTAKKGQKEKGKYQVQLLDAENLQVQRTVETKSLLHFRALSSGYVDLTPNMAREVWLVRFGPDAKQKAAITRVRSKCVPDVAHPSGNTILVGRCSSDGKGYSMTALTVAGQRLWHQRWPDERFRLAIASSESGGRFAYSALRRPADWKAASQTDLKDAVASASESLEQVVEVLETAGGHALLKLSPSRPFYGHNFALSPAGDSIAVLNDTLLSVYPLPPVPQEEQAKFAAIQADVPDLYLVPDDEELSATGQTASADPDADLVDTTASTSTEAGGASPTSTATGTAQATTAGSAAPSADDAPSLTIKSSAVAVAVDVVVTDSKGVPIKGLKNSDFVVSEDGTPQRIRFMDELDFDAKASGANAAAKKTDTRPDANSRPNIFSNLSRPEVKTVTIILYDILNTSPSDQSYSRQQLIKYLKNKPPDMRVAIFAIARNLRMISGFTDEENALIATITGKGRRGKKGGLPVSPGMFSRAPYQAATGFDFASNAFPPGMESAMSQMREAGVALESANMDFRVNATLDSFAQLARYLSGLPGRKNVIWLSGSFPLNIDPSLDVNRNASGTMRSYFDRVKQITNLLAKAHVAVYPVNVKGLQVYDYGDQYLSGNTRGSSVGSTNGMSSPTNLNSNETADLLAGVDMSIQNQMATSLAENSAMNLIASATGGKAFYNTNDIGSAIQQSVTQASHYYMLSYTPANRKFDGKFRKIRVNAGDKKYRLSYRNGYYAEDPDRPIGTDMATEFAAGAMQHGSPESHQIPFLVRVAPVGEPHDVSLPVVAAAKKDKKAKSPGVVTTKAQHLDIDYLVPARSLRFTVSPEGKYLGNFNIMIAAYGPDGDTLTNLGGRSSMDLKPEEYTKLLTTGLRMHQEVDIPVSAITLRLGIQDAFTANLGTTEIPLPVPPLPGLQRRRGKAMPQIEAD